MPYHVYFIQAGQGGPIQIASAARIADALGRLQEAEPGVGMRLLGWIRDGGAAMAADLRLRFSDIDRGGSWFDPDARLLEYLLASSWVLPPQALGRRGRPRGQGRRLPRSFDEVVEFCRRIIAWGADPDDPDDTVARIMAELKCSRPVALEWIARARSIEGLMHTPDCL